MAASSTTKLLLRGLRSRISSADKVISAKKFLFGLVGGQLGLLLGFSSTYYLLSISYIHSQPADAVIERASEYQPPNWGRPDFSVGSATR